MVKGLNNDAVAIKMVDNPADLQAVIPNEIIIIIPAKKKRKRKGGEHLSPFNNLHHCLNVLHMVDSSKSASTRAQVAFC